MPPASRSHRRTLMTGAIIVVICVLFALTPILLGRGVISNSIVAFSLIGLCIGGSVLLNGAFDWWRQR